MEFYRKLRYGMIGGGPGAFVGNIHRKAAALDGHMELVAGVFSSSPEKSQQMGRSLHLDPQRVYDSYQKMCEQEAKLSEEDRLDFVSVVPPNHLHFPVASLFMKSGFHIVCDKPMTNTVEEANDLCHLADKHGLVFALTHNYTGYPMVKEARQIVKSGKLGQLRKIMVEYHQGSLVKDDDSRLNSWKNDPEKVGVSAAIADIGSHAENLVEYITGLEIEKLFADVTSFSKGWKLEDDANMLMHYTNGARGVLSISKVATGEENGLTIRVYGTEAALEWHQEQPNNLYIKYPDKPEEIYKRGNPYLSEEAKFNTRIPHGHPEAFIEAFANIYRNVGSTILAKEKEVETDPIYADFPTVRDGLRGVRFIHKAMESAQKDAWVEIA